jgi:hypothetical protein
MGLARHRSRTPTDQSRFISISVDCTGLSSATSASRLRQRCRESRSPSHRLAAAGTASHTRIERRLRRDLDDLAAERSPAELAGRSDCQEPIGDQRDRVALLGFGHLLGRHEGRDAPVAQAMELVPDRPAEERIDARGRLVEDEEVGLVDQRAGELQATLHSPDSLTARRPRADHRSSNSRT